MNKKSGQYFVKVAEKNGLIVKNGKGDHVKVYGPAGRGYMTVPLHSDLSTGVRYSIIKWFKAIGILVTLIGILVAIF